MRCSMNCGSVAAMSADQLREFDMEDLKKNVLSIYPFFGGICARTIWEPSDKVRRIGSDGTRIYYQPSYLASLPEEEQVFLAAHELAHVAFHHVSRGAGKDPLVWRDATDAVVNQLLKRDGLSLPASAIDYPEAIGYDAEQFYEILLEQKLEIELEGGQLEGQSSAARGNGEKENAEQTDPAGEEIPEDHSLWEEAVQKQEEEEQRRQNQLLRELEKIGELMEEMQDLEQQDGGMSMEELEGEDPEDLAILGKRISRAGNAMRPDDRTVGRIGTGLPRIDWRLVLRETINFNVDWSMQHAVLEDGIVRPVLEEQPAPEAEIVLDTSWSVDEELLREFLRECKNILQNAKMKVGCFDTVFYGFREIRTEKDIEDMVFPGGGGTDFNAAVGAFSMRVDNRIIFTDGQAPMPEKPMDAVWMVYGEEPIDPPGGKVIHIPAGDRE